jgi:acetyl-CoA carboxylase carboxyl transferase subunit alpha
VITAEGCAAILWKTAEAKDKAAAALRITANDLLSLGVIDEIIPEPVGGAHNDWDIAAAALEDALHRHLEQLVDLDVDALRSQRWAKYAAMGVTNESGGEGLSVAPSSGEGSVVEEASLEASGGEAAGGERPEPAG